MISLCAACGQIVNRLLLYKDFMEIHGFVEGSIHFDSLNAAKPPLIAPNLGD